MTELPTAANANLPKVVHRTPCRECPFRRKSPRGWLGGGRVEEWAGELRFGDTAFLCHMAVRKNKRHFCAGSMIFYRNSIKWPRDPEFADAVSLYLSDTETVFQWADEFERHHSEPLGTPAANDR